MVEYTTSRDDSASLTSTRVSGPNDESARFPGPYTSPAAAIVPNDPREGEHDPTIPTDPFERAKATAAAYFRLMKPRRCSSFSRPVGTTASWSRCRFRGRSTHRHRSLFEVAADYR